MLDETTNSIESETQDKSVGAESKSTSTESSPNSRNVVAWEKMAEAEKAT